MEHKDPLLIQQHRSLFQIAVKRSDERRRQEHNPIVSGLAASDNRPLRRQVQVIESQSQHLRKAQPGMSQGQEPGSVKAGAVDVSLVVYSEPDSSISFKALRSVSICF